MKFLLYGFFCALVIPLISHSLEPKNPSDACERFINDSEKAACLKKTQNENIDWYASSLCEKIDDDKIFMTCFDSIQKAQYEPKAIETCERLTGDQESEKVKCLNLVKNKITSPCQTSESLSAFESCLKSKSARLPASNKSFFQKK